MATFFSNILIPIVPVVLSALSADVVSAQDNSLFTPHPNFQTMSQRWELDKATRRGTFIITPYKPVFITAGRWSDNPNKKPTSENPYYTLPFRVNYNNYEAKFVLSFKTKLLQDIIAGKGDLWIGYTQKAHWQLYNEALSRPFRELNYEPELIFNIATNYPFLGFRGRMAGVSFNHQSNGRSLPLSRSWNRVVFHAGFERGGWQVMLRPWIRLHDEIDENPAIADFTGRGEAVVVRDFKRHQLSLVGAHSLRTGNKSRGSIVASWVFVIRGNLKSQVQFSEGYGETLQDYNHRQTTIGVSLSLVEW